MKEISAENFRRTATPELLEAVTGWLEGLADHLDGKHLTKDGLAGVKTVLYDDNGAVQVEIFDFVAPLPTDDHGGDWPTASWIPAPIDPPTALEELAS